MEEPRVTVIPIETTEPLSAKGVAASSAPPPPLPLHLSNPDDRSQPPPSTDWSYRAPRGYYTQASLPLPEKRASAGFYGQAQPSAPPPPPYSQHPPGYTQVIIIEEVNFHSKEVRLRFIRKVYSILSIQLLFTTGLIALFLYEPNVNRFVQEHVWLIFISMIIYIVVYLMLVCVESLRRNSPINIIMLMIFTVSLAFVAALMATFFKQEVVLMSFGITAVVCLLVTIFAMQSKFDFTMCGAFLMVASILLIIFAIVLIFFTSRLLLYIYASIATLLFTLFLAYDTQTIMGGRAIQLAPNEYILGAIQLYLDIIMIFLNILQLCGMANLGVLGRFV